MAAVNTVEIHTAQNVRIEFETAGLGLRVFAFLTDLLLMVLVFVVLSWLISIYMPLPAQELLQKICGFLCFGFYTLFFEFTGNGQTPGKRAMGIRVIKLNGSELDFYDCFSRWSTRLFDIYLSAGSIAAILISGRRSGQRLGDMLAGTTLIRSRGTHGFRLADILRLNEKKMEANVYSWPRPLAERLSEQDVMLIKTVLRRQRLFPNRAQREALEMLCERLRQVLELDDIPANREAFLNKLISDYIITTR